MQNTANLAAKSCGVCIVSWSPAYWQPGDCKEISHSESVDWLDWTAGPAHVYHISGSDVRQGSISHLGASRQTFSPAEAFCQIAVESLSSVWEPHLTENCVVERQGRAGWLFSPWLQYRDIVGLDGNISQYWSDLDLVVCTYYNTEHINTGTDVERKIT